MISVLDPLLKLRFNSAVAVPEGKKFNEVFTDPCPNQHKSLHLVFKYRPHSLFSINTNINMAGFVSLEIPESNQHATICDNEYIMNEVFTSCNVPVYNVSTYSSSDLNVIKLILSSLVLTAFVMPSLTSERHNIIISLIDEKHQANMTNEQKTKYEQLFWDFTNNDEFILLKSNSGNQFQLLSWALEIERNPEDTEWKVIDFIMIEDSNEHLVVDCLFPNIDHEYLL